LPAGLRAYLVGGGASNLSGGKIDFPRERD
jgi:hypothetical protein